MLKFQTRPVRAAATKLAPLILLAALGACKGMDSTYTEDNFTPVMHDQRFPITVSKGRVKVAVPTSRPYLTSAQENTIIRFARQAKSSGARRVAITRPANDVNADVMAGRITQLLARNGIGARVLVHSTYRGSRGAPVTLSFVRAFAHTKQCGDWSKDLTRTASNKVYKNFGCTQQHNIAAMVANPNDFVTPRTTTAADTTRRNKVLGDYQKATDTSTTSKGNDKVKVSNVN